MDISLTPADLAVHARAREMVEKHFYPYEIELEMNGTLPDATIETIKQGVRDYGFNGWNHTKEDGGQGLTMVQKVLLHEELGKVTGVLWTLCFGASLPLMHGTEEQRCEFLYPCNEGTRRSCYAITEPDAGSDARMVKTRADFRNGKYYITGEKWFVTTADYADIILVHAIVDGDPDKPSLFIVEKNQPGVIVKREPKFMHTYLFEHYEMLFDNVEVDPSRLLGKVGGGLDLTKDWFTDTRIELGAHGVGAAIRATEIANDFAAKRVQFGHAIRDFQAIEFMLADMAVEIMAAKSMLYRIAAEVDRGLDRKLTHAKASAIKLYASEMAGRVVDKAVQIMGGRGYMRENPVERLYRDVRVDRIWEGTSEIQRVIIGGQIKKRGLDIYTGWN
ncbi:MAG: acyl-CoA dehydrogenase family protein [Rhodospirillaceae bacterium]|nr:acyl-CoA dehydrogenase family protein [Rhodospirillaceae bacterium]